MADAQLKDGGAHGRLGSYSVVIPIFNEEETIPELFRRLTAVLESLADSLEVIFVDDGSADASFAELKRLHHLDRRVRVLRFSRNFGQHIALTAGIDHAVGDAIILIDADLQDPPEEIPKLLAKFKEGYDVVYGIRPVRPDRVWRRLASRIFWAVLGRLTGQEIPAHQTVLRVMSARFVRHLRRMPERARFLAGMIAWLGFAQASVVIERSPRFAGRSHYGLGNLVKLGLHAITSFSYVPLRMSAYLGFFVSGLSFVYACYLIVRKLGWGVPVAGWASLMVAALFLGGVQLVMLGIIGEYLGRVYSEVQGRPLYVIAESLSDASDEQGIARGS